MKLVAWNSAKKTEADASLTIAFPELTEILPGRSLTLDMATRFGAKGKLTNSEVGIRLYAGGDCIQEARVNADWWNGACDGTGAYFVAKTFGDKAMTHADWMPTATELAGRLAFAELYTSTTGDGDTGEYIVLTNLTSKALDLADLKIVAWNAKKKSEAEPSLVLTLGDVTVAAGGTVTLDQATCFGEGKLTNSKVGLKLYDPAGACVQEAAVDAEWWSKACDGTGASFEALEFGACVDQVAQWRAKLPAPQDWPEDPDAEITDATTAADLGIVPGEVPSIEGEFNGTVTVWGATTLEGGGDWSAPTEASRFFKATLTR